MKVNLRILTDYLNCMDSIVSAIEEDSYLLMFLTFKLQNYYFIVKTYILFTRIQKVTDF